MKQIYSLILFAFVLASCSQEEIISNPADIATEEKIRFAASLAEPVETRAGTTNLPNIEITVIGPGYGSNAANQKVKYKVVNLNDYPSNESSVLEAVDSEVVMKRSAKEMYFTAWTEPDGVEIDELGAGTVDFTADLDHFIGAHVKEEEPTSDLIDLEFRHLVAKVTMKVYNIAEDKNKTLGSTENSEMTITFPAIKQFGTVAATLANPPAVTAGSTGGSLEIRFSNESNENDSSAEFYLPPLSASDLLMYGSFTIMVGSTTYVGTLNNLAFSEAAPEIEAGQHIIIKVHINDDHTALLQAVTLAPWTEYPTNLYNRPVPGIWGMEDLVLFSQAVNEGTIENYWDEDSSPLPLYRKHYFFADDNDEENGNPIVRLYADISLEDADDFLPIGTDDNPFEGITFDGNGYTISGLTLDKSTADNQGLFGVIEDAKLFKIKVNNATITGNNNVGILAGKISGETLIDRCSATGGTVSGEGNVGGLVGYIDNSNSEIDHEPKIYNSWVSLETVSGESRTGGLVGYNTGIIANSYVRLSRGIACSGTDGGGFVGHNSGTIENCYSQASFIQRPTNCGAWVGYNAEGAVNNGCYWNRYCIDNKYCHRVIGNSPDDEDGLEDYSLLLSGRRYHDSTGYLLNDNEDHSTYLRTELNNNKEKSANKKYYSNWAVLYDNPLPVLSSNNFD